METRSADNRIWTRVSDDGKHAAAGIGMKPGAGGEPQPYNELGQYAANSHANIATDAGGGPHKSPLGGTKRGKEMGKRYVLPSSVVEENRRIALVYSQSSGKLKDMEDRLVGKGSSGAPGHVNDPDSQGNKDLGVIPEGTWTIGETIWDRNETHGKGENLIKLEPDDETRARLGRMKPPRDPDTFYIHAGKMNGEQTASQGCIIIPDKKERQAIRELQGAKIRVVR